MLMDYFSSYQLHNKSTHFQEEKNSPKLRDCQIFIVIKVTKKGIQTLVLIYFKKKKKCTFLIFHTCFPENVSAYHTGSVYEQTIHE